MDATEFLNQVNNYLSKQLPCPSQLINYLLDQSLNFFPLPNAIY
jgi:hypothetical protein